MNEIEFMKMNLRQRHNLQIRRQQLHRSEGCSCSDTTSQPSQQPSHHGTPPPPKKGKNTQCAAVVWRKNAELMSGVRGQWADWLETIEKQE